MDTVFDSLPSDDIEILGQIQDKLQNSPAVDALAEKYAQAMIQELQAAKNLMRSMLISAMNWFRLPPLH